MHHSHSGHEVECATAWQLEVFLMIAVIETHPAWPPPT